MFGSMAENGLVGEIEGSTAFQHDREKCQTR